MKTVRTLDEFLLEATARGLVICIDAPLTGLDAEDDDAHEAHTTHSPPQLGGIWVMRRIIGQETSPEDKSYIGIFFDTPEERNMVMYMGGPQ